MTRLFIISLAIVVPFLCQADEAANVKKNNDVLAAAINASLAQRPTVVYWVVDASESMVAKRKDIAQRLDRVLFLVNNRGLRNAVVSFGQRVNFITPSPTQDLGNVAAVLEQIPVDETGTEFTFAAVQAVAEKCKVLRGPVPKNNAMIIVFTDEAGNDGTLADKTSTSCRSIGVPVYVVGIPAPFGIREQRIRRDPESQQDEMWNVVESGPESLRPEVVHLPNDPPLDSGFGPFLLSKLCAATGGAYFRANTADGDVFEDETARKESGLHKFFSPDTMESYRPNYASLEALEGELASNRAKNALVEAATKASILPVNPLQTVFPRKDDAALRQLFSECQKAVAINQPRIDGLYVTLEAGLSDREKLEEKRWQAGYDLSLGRLLAWRVRADSYGLMLARAKDGMSFKEKNSDTWELVPSEKLPVDSEFVEIAKQAKALLEKVVAEHPGTPWAYYAAEELKHGMGYKWIERATKGHGDSIDPPLPATLRSQQKRQLKRI